MQQPQPTPTTAFGWKEIVADMGQRPTRHRVRGLRRHPCARGCLMRQAIRADQAKMIEAE